MSYRDTLALSIRTFWALAKNINRIRAEEDRRMLTMISNAVGGGAEYLEALNEERGTVVEESRDYPHIDRAGIERIKAMMGATKRLP